MELAPIAEPQLILYKDNASARAMKLISIAGPQLILCKDTPNIPITKLFCKEYEYHHEVGGYN